MKPMRTAIYVELRKALAARMLRTTTLLIVAGIVILAGSLAAAATNGNEQILTQLGPLADETGWKLLTGIAAQITAAGGMLAFGVALSWIFGREFTDGTISGLFAMPISRPMIALAKLFSYILWTVAVAFALAFLTLIAGLIFEFGSIDGDVLSALVRQTVLTILVGMLATPAGWAATLGRGPLPGIAVTIMLLVAAQITAIAVPDAAAWIPFSAPVLWALQPDAVHIGQLALVALIPVFFSVLTGIAWRRLQLDQ